MNKQKLFYQELLKDPRWIKRRNEILSRDHNTCVMCGAQDKYLHVHHLKYIVRRKPWEYSDDDLVTLCEDCHQRVHSSSSITGISIGDIFSYSHSDWYMNYLVFDIDCLRNTVYVLGCDTGANFDTVYNETYDADVFREKCQIVVEPRYLNYLFKEWFEFLVSDLRNTPQEFQKNLVKIVNNNPIIKDIYNQIK